MITTLKDYISAGCSFIHIRTSEFGRAERIVKENFPKYSFNKKGAIAKNIDINDEFPKGSQHFINTIYNEGKKKELFTIVISPNNIPSEVSNYFVSVELPLPDEEKRKDIIDGHLKELNFREISKVINEIVFTTSGMTENEISDALYLSFVKTKTFDKDLIQNFKNDIINKSGILERVPLNGEQIGGFENYLKWAEVYGKLYRQYSKAMGLNLPTPKGCFMCGVSGTGKTHSAKVTAKLFGLPLYRLDVGKLYNQYLGETERNTREVKQLIERLSPCIILVDEIEKSWSSFQTGDTDGNVTGRVMADILYWLEERRVSAFMFATANGIVPMHFLRRGRWDEVWFVDMPNWEQRLQLFHIYSNEINFTNPFGIRDATEGFTGSDIKTVVQQARYKAFYEDREVEEKDITSTIYETIPIVKLKEDEVKELREQSKYMRRV